MENQNQNLPWGIEKIIEMANCLASTGSSGASTGERIAAAFVLNNPAYLPSYYDDMVKSWDSLGDEWHGHQVPFSEALLQISLVIIPLISS